MSDIFPLTDYPRYFIPTASVNFTDYIIDDILDNIFYPGIKEENSNKSFPAIMNISSFVERLTPEDAMFLVDDFHNKNFKKRRIPYFEEIYNRDKIYQQYIDLKPTCFLVLGKPSKERYKTAQKYAGEMNRVHLDVNELVNLEIARGSTCGRWIYTNLIAGRTIPISIVLHLLRQAMNQNAVKSRGYVLSGFPIIPEYEFSPFTLPKCLNKMDSLKWPRISLIQDWLRRSKDEILDPTVKQVRFNTGEEKFEGSLSEESLSAFSSSTKQDQSESESVINTEEQQLHEEEASFQDVDSRIPEDESTILFDIMNNRDLKNELHESDVIRSVRKQFKFLLHLNLSPDVIFFIRNKDDERIFPNRKSINSDKFFYRPRNETGQTESASSAPSLCKMMRSHAEIIYDTDFLQARYIKSLWEIGTFVMHYNKESIIKVDGRYSVDKAVEQFHTSMKLSNYKKIHEARHVFFTAELRDTLSEESLDEAFEQLRKENLIQKNLKWHESEFGTKCAVKLFEGKIKQGRIEYAAEYLGHIFLISCMKSMKLFLRNPNKYFFCKPNCRIAIISMDTNPTTGVSTIFKTIFNSESFDWKDAVNESPEIRSMDIYSEARQWAEDTLNTMSSANPDATESLKRVALQNWTTLFQSTINKLLNLLTEDFTSEESIAAIEYLKDIGVDTNEDTIFNTLKALQSDADLRKNYIPAYLTEVSMNLVKDEQLINKITAVRFYELYKLKHATDISAQTIAWIKDMDRHILNRTNGEQKFGQWLIEDAPTTIEYWKKLEESHCLPDVVLIFQSTWGMNYTHPGGLAGHRLSQQDDIEGIVSNLINSFPKLFAEKGFDLKKILHEASNLSMTPINSVNPLVRLVRSVKLNEEPEEDEDEVLIEQLTEYLNSKNIEVIMNVVDGVPRDALGILEEYLKIFKPKAKILSENDLKTLYELDREIEKQITVPKIGHIQNGTTFNLDLSYFRKDAIFDSDEENVQDSQDEEEEEDEDSVESTESLMAIDEISEKNVENIKERTILRHVAFGNTRRYCPVMFTDFNYLHFGQSEYTVEYNNKLYMMATEEDRDRFIERPFKYTDDNIEPTVPPFRVCVIGPFGPNKAIFSSVLSLKLNLSSKTYRNLMTEFLELNGLTSSTEFSSEDEIYTTFAQDFLTKHLKDRFDAGMILEGFPINRKQFLDMMHHRIIPEIIFVVDCNPKLIVHNIFQHFYRIWEDQLKIKTQRYREELARFEQQSYEGGVEDKLSTLSRLSEMSLQKEATFASNTGSARNSLNESVGEHDDLKSDDYPENPIPTDKDMARIKAELLKKSRKFLKQHLQSIKDVLELCVTYKIPIIRIPRKIKKKEKRIRAILCYMCNTVNRPFLFNQVQVVTLEAAKECLRRGYCLYSHFKNFCPVDAHNLIPINLHYSMKKQGHLYACIFRNLLYYINGKDNLDKFYAKARLYVNNENPFHLVNPMRIAVIGPECSGVSTLCKRVSKEFNMTHLNRNRFFHGIRDDLTHSKLNEKIMDRPYTAPKIPIESISDSEALVECLHLHRNDSPNGIILDNYPVTPNDILEAAESNICFHIVLIIKTDFRAIWRNWKTSYEQTKQGKYVPVLDELIRMLTNFIGYNRILKLYERGPKELKLFNIVLLKRTNSIWAQWEDARNEILICLREIGSYNLNLRSGKCVGITHLNIFESEFEKRLSAVELLCPVCLKRDQKLVKYRYDYHHVGVKFYNINCQREFNQPYGYNLESLYDQYEFPKMYRTSTTRNSLYSKNMFKTNLVQFQGNFYWTCDEHHLDILLNAEDYLPVVGVQLPPYIPFLVADYFANYVQHDGFCIVTYCENVPERVLERGSHNFPVFYRGKIFLCASADCAIKFLEDPHFYYHQKIPKIEKSVADWDIHDIQIDYGTLTPELLIEALLALGEQRPKHLAQNVADSAAIFLGLYLKTVNPVSDLKTIKLYEEINSKFVHECALLSTTLNEFQMQHNPFILKNSQKK